MAAQEFDIVDQDLYRQLKNDDFEFAEDGSEG